jgi:hypothetical protein
VKRARKKAAASPAPTKAATPKVPAKRTRAKAAAS